MGCDPLPAPVVRAVVDFNPRTHVGCDCISTCSAVVLFYFNPRTHVGCDLPASVCPHRLPISIHAPTWGATIKGCRLTVRASNFNPRTHVGCDVSIALLRSVARISIHAPTWGATRPKSYFIPDKFISIHAPTWGATVVYLFSSCANTFQSTHPRGVRHLSSGRFKNFFIYFNPRTHVGCDRGEIRCCSKLAISIHAPTWGATFSGYVMEHVCAISIHAPTWGATFLSITHISTHENFNPRTHVGCDNRRSAHINQN